jgi:hypothetical protein
MADPVQHAARPEWPRAVGASSSIAKAIELATHFEE